MNDSPGEYVDLKSKLHNSIKQLSIMDLVKFPHIYLLIISDTTLVFLDSRW